MVVERAADIESFDDFDFLPSFTRRVGWRQFFKNNVGECNATICREFIASLIEKENYESFAYVRGKPIAFTPHILSNFLHLPVVAKYTLPYPPNVDPPADSLVYEILTGTPLVDNKFKIHATKLLPQFYKLWMVVCNSIYPTTHKNHLYIDEALLVYNISIDANICLMRYFVKIIGRTETKTDSKESIKMGVLITKLCLHFGVVPKEGDQLIKQLGIVNNSTLKRSQAQLHLQTTGERGMHEEEGGPTAMEEEEEEDVQPLRRRKKVPTERGEGSSTQAPQATDLEAIQQMMLAMEERQMKRFEDFRQESNAQYEALARQEEARAKRNEEQYNEILAHFQGWDTRFQSWQPYFQPPPPPPPM